MSELNGAIFPSEEDQYLKKESINIKELVQHNFVQFDSYRQGVFYYNIVEPIAVGIGHMHYNKLYQFMVPVDDIGTATLLAQDKALTYMRWIRKAIEDKTLLKL